MSYPPPRYDGTGEASASLRPSSRPADLRIGAGAVVHHLATGATTGGDYGLYRWEMPGPPSGPGPHFHRSMSEAFFVLSGRVRLHNGRRWTDAGPGDFLHVPPGGVHGFRNESGEPAAMLLLFTPGAPREAYFAELAEIAASGRQPSEEEWRDIYARHDQVMV